MLVGNRVAGCRVIGGLPVFKIKCVLSSIVLKQIHYLILYKFVFGKQLNCDTQHELSI